MGEEIPATPGITVLGVVYPAKVVTTWNFTQVYPLSAVAADVRDQWKFSNEAMMRVCLVLVSAT